MLKRTTLLRCCFNEMASLKNDGCCVARIVAVILRLVFFTTGLCSAADTSIPVVCVICLPLRLHLSLPLCASHFSKQITNERISNHRLFIDVLPEAARPPTSYEHPIFWAFLPFTSPFHVSLSGPIEALDLRILWFVVKSVPCLANRNDKLVDIYIRLSNKSLH